MSKEKRLGRGLEALLGKVAAAQPVTEGAEGTSYALEGTSFGDVSDYDEETPTDQAITEMMRGKPILDIPVSQIDRNPYQPRLDFDLAELNDLAASIQRFGMLQPIVLRRQQDRYELIAGERRLRAAVLAGWKEVPAYLLVVQDREMAELALTENMQRQDLNAIEKAIAFRNYLDTYGGTQEELAKRLEGHGVTALIYTDIARDGMLMGPNFEAIRELAESVSIPVIASGGVSSLEDIRRLMALDPAGVTGVVVGKALYSGAVRLSEAVKLVKGQI